MRLRLDGSALDLDALAAVRGEVRVDVPEDAWERVAASRSVVDDLVRRGEVAYGITTGFGEFAHVRIEPEQVRQLQANLLMSHAVGVGEPLRRDVVRAMMLIRANTLLKGYSGVRRILIERLLLLFEKGLVPVVPSRGSVGSSGDLAPLAHLSLPLVGMGSLDDGNGARPALEVLEEYGLEPLVLEAKEGIALINGTQMMAALGGLVVHDALLLLQDAQIVAAMCIEALMGSRTPFDADIHALRPHPGQIQVAANLRTLTEGSAIVESHAGCERVQDAYSLRCAPQVLGACRDALLYGRETLERELNSATDNPLVFPDGRILSGGNFHGEPLAIVLDMAAIALSEVANISERRTERLVNPDLSEGLKPFLIDRGGLNSGFMIAQYTAAALVSENKILCHPASVDSIPTSAGQEDHNSMGSISALKLVQVLRNARRVLAIEALCAAQGLEGRLPAQPGAGAAAALKAVRGVVPTLLEDRILSDDIETIVEMMRQGVLRKAVAGAGIRLD